MTLQAERLAAEAVRARWAELKAALERQGFEVGDLAVAADGGFEQTRDGSRHGSREGGDEAGREEEASPFPQVVDLDL